MSIRLSDFVSLSLLGTGCTRAAYLLNRRTFGLGNAQKTATLLTRSNLLL
jgi:hypothetical protein